MLIDLNELLVVSFLIVLMGWECLIAIRSRSWVQIYRPTLFVAVVLAFYALVGPLRAILSTGEVANFVGTSGTIFRGLDHRPYLFWGWLGALFFYGFLLLGFHIHNPKSKPSRRMVKTDLNRIRRWGTSLCWIGLLMYSVVNGGKVIYLLNPLAPHNFSHSLFGFDGFDLGFASSYFVLAINLLIPGILIQFSVWLRQRKNLWIVSTWFAITILIYLSEAFRYRILFLILPLFFLWLFYNKRRPMLIWLLAFMLSFVTLSGFIGIARTQFRGLDINKAASASTLDVLLSSFEEAGAFFTSSVVIESVPRQYPYLGLEPIYTALLQPLPRRLFPNKPPGLYSSEIPDQIYADTWWGIKTHAAFLAYAEYYLMFGWTSLCLISFALGVALKRIWNWFLWRQYEPLAQTVYLLNASYLYVVVSRGYLAQIVVLYCFTILPAFLVYYKLAERVK